MNQVVHFVVTLDEPINTVSYALNGLFKVNGQLTELRYDYHVNPLSNTRNMSLEDRACNVYPDFYAYCAQIDVHLDEVGSNETKATFTIRKNSIKAKTIACTVCVVMAALIMVMCMAAVPLFDSVLLSVLFAIALTCVLFGYLPFLPYLSCRDKVILKKFKKLFLPRVMKYIEIVVRNTVK